MVRTFKYRLVKASWAIAIDIAAEVNFPTALPAKAVNIKDGLWLAIVPQWLSDDEQRYLTLGMTLVADSILALAKTETGRILVNVLDVQYNPCHYQSEGLAAALMGWAAEEFSFRVKEIPVVVDRARKRYIYKFWDSQTVALPAPVSGAMQAPLGRSTPLTRKVAPVGLSYPTRVRFDFPVAGNLSRASVQSELAYPPRVIGGPPQSPFHNKGSHSLQTREINGKNGHDRPSLDDTLFSLHN